MAMRRTLLAVVVCMTLQSVILGGTTRPATEKPFDQLMPNSTAVFFYVPDSRELGQAFRQTQIYKLCQDPRMQPFIQRLPHLLDRIRTELISEAGLRLVDLAHLPVGQCAIGLKLAPSATHPGKYEPAGMIGLVEVGTRIDAAKRVMDSLVAKAMAGGARRKTIQVGGVTVVDVRFPGLRRDRDGGEMQGWAYFLAGQLLGAAHHLSDVRHLLAARSGQAPPRPALATSAGYQRVVKRLGKQQLYLYVDIGRMRHFVTQLAAKQGGMARSVIQGFGLDRVEALGLSASFSQQQYDGLMKVTVQVGVEDRGLPENLHLPPGEVEVEPFVPAEAVGYFGLRWDIPRFYDDLIRSLEKVRMARLVEFMIRGGFGLKDFNFRDEIVQTLGTRISVYNVYREPVTLASSKDLLAVELADAAAFRRGFTKLLSKLTTRHRREGDLFVFGDPATDKARYVAILPGHVVYSNDRAMVADALKHAGGRPDGLASLADFQRVKQAIPTGVSGAGFSSSRRVGRYAHQLFRTNQIATAVGFIATMLGRDGRVAARLLDGTDLPEWSAIRHYFGTAGSYFVVDDDGFLWCQFSLRPKPSE